MVTASPGCMARIARTTTVPSGLKKYAALGQQLWLSLLVSLQHMHMQAAGLEVCPWWGANPREEGRGGDGVHS